MTPFYAFCRHSQPLIFKRYLLVIWAFSLACVLLSGCSQKPENHWVFSCPPDNDLYKTFVQSGLQVQRFEDHRTAISMAPTGATVLLLSSKNGNLSSAFPVDMMDDIREKHLSIYIEQPDTLPGLRMAGVKVLDKERLVINSGEISPGLEQSSNPFIVRQINQYL